ncbi:MAG: MATE family efflux transporter [Muribaculaceae bacterium]|nr:MATE family efflux transporter [Muribaculaceae bacterium]
MDSASKIGISRRAEYAELFRLGFPVLLTQLGVIVMSFTDTMMVGAYGVTELAASAFVNSVFLIPMVMLSGLAAGLTPLVGALFTRNNNHEVGRIARAGLQINLIVGCIFTIVMTSLFFFLDRFGQAPEILPSARSYYITMLTTIVPMALFNSLTQTSNGLTDTRTPMWFVLGAIVLNILGNWLLIFGHWGFPRMGLTGAGVATSIARAAGLIGIAIVYLRSKRYAPWRPGLLNPGKLAEERRLVWRTSYPVMIQTGIECALWSFGAVVCGWYGKIQLAAYQIVNTIGQLGFMTYMSFGVAVSIRVANFTGLGDEHAARMAVRAGLHLNMLLATIASLLMALCSRGLLSLFTPDTDVIAAGEALILPLVLYQYLDATQLTFMNAIRGTSQVKPLLWIALSCYVIIGVPILLLFAEVLRGENVGVYYSFNVALLCAAILGYLVFRRIRIAPPPAQSHSAQ